MLNFFLFNEIPIGAKSSVTCCWLIDSHIFMKSNSTRKNVSAPPVMYVKLSIYLRKYMESRYGKDVVIVPFMSPMYGAVSGQ